MGNIQQRHYYAFIKKEGDNSYQIKDIKVKPFDINLL